MSKVAELEETIEDQANAIGRGFIRTEQWKNRYNLLKERSEEYTELQGTLAEAREKIALLEDEILALREEAYLKS